MSRRIIGWVAAGIIAGSYAGTARPADPTPSGLSYPTAQAPFIAGRDDAKRDALKLEVKTLLDAAPENVVAHPAASDFPGTVPDNATSVTCRVTVNPQIDGWVSTGIYAIPGKPITITIPDAAAAWGLSIQVGCHSDTLWNKEKWTRVPRLVNSRPIKAATASIANPFGGLVYVVVPGHVPATAVTFEAKIAGGIVAPSFILGKTTPQEWAMVKNSPAPWGELVGKSLICSLPADKMRAMKDPAVMAAFWDRVMQAEDKLAGGPVRKGPMRFVVCRQISAGWGHSGYPAMGEMPWANGIVAESTLAKGDWGMFHELGHNHGYGPFSLPGMGEVSVNLHSMYVLQQVCGLPLDQVRCMIPGSYDKALARYFGSDQNYNTCSDLFVKLIFYGQLVQGFGWGPFEKMFAEVRNSGPVAKNDFKGWDHVLVRFSEITGKNLGPYFGAWRIIVSESAKAKVSALPVWMPEPGFPARYKTSASISSDKSPKT